MAMTVSFEAVADAVRDGKQDRAVDLVNGALREGVTPARILAEGLIPGMQGLGELFKDGQAFLPEIMISARAMEKALGELRPHLVGGGVANVGTVVLGTVEGDLHDIGKNLVGMLLEGNGFKVIDLGVSVSATAFVEAASRHAADVVALSALLTTTIPQFALIVRALDSAGLHGKVKVMVGGAPVSRALADEVGAEGFAENCVVAVDEARRLVGELAT
jgi:5-methyltetrahydrofolate--homocysteine methyltransferase